MVVWVSTHYERNVGAAIPVTEFLAAIIKTWWSAQHVSHLLGGMPRLNPSEVYSW